MSVMVSLMAALLTQTAPDPQPFRLTEVTVTDLERVGEVSDLRNLSYVRLNVRSSDGATGVVYVPGWTFEDRRIWKTDVCRFEGRERPWLGDRSLSLRTVVPARGEIVRVADDFQCREGSEGHPADPDINPLFLPSPTTPPLQTTAIVVTGVGISPRIPSGILHTATLILGQTEDGDIDPYYLTFFGDEWPVPPLGSRCVLHHREYQLELVGGLSTRPMDKADYISDFDCEPPPSDEEMVRMNMARLIEAPSRRQPD